jgi:three-Cys-motif partner protein
LTAPKSSIWKAEPHTLAKHAVLRNYLEAWFPILGRWNGRVIYYDGFAGPGRYEGGEQGSPIVAIEVAMGHAERLKNCELVFVFVEEDEERARWLRDVELPKLKLAPNFKTEVRHDPFERALRGTLDALDQQRLDIAPTFAFIDPFGLTGLPFELIHRLLNRQRCEALITFMTREVNRFVTRLPEQIGTLIGDPNVAAAIHGAANGAVEARRVYELSLRRAARFVRTFRMRDENDALIYDLFYATNHPLGHTRMKEAMWHVDASGGFSFSDGLDPNQSVLFKPNAGLDLAPRLWAQFRGQKLYAKTILEHVENETPFLAKHCREALILLEEGSCPGAGQVVVDALKKDGSKRRARTFPGGAIVRFSE